MSCKHNYRHSQGYFFCINCGHKTSGKSHRAKKTARNAIIVSAILMIGIFGYLAIEGKIFIIEPIDSVVEIKKNSDSIINKAKTVTQNITNGISSKIIDETLKK